MCEVKQSRDKELTALAACIDRHRTGVARSRGVQGSVICDGAGSRVLLNGDGEGDGGVDDGSDGKSGSGCGYRLDDVPS